MKRRTRGHGLTAVALFAVVCGVIAVLLGDGSAKPEASASAPAPSMRSALEATRAAEVALAEENYGRARGQMFRARRVLEALLEEEHEQP
jgi:hypothetical protein